MTSGMNVNKQAVPFLTDTQAVHDMCDKWDIKRYELAKACGIGKSTLNSWDHMELTQDRLVTINNGLNKIIRAKRKALLNTLD